MNSFPQELIDAIIDEIPGVKPYSDLKSCVLVAKAFRRQAQRHLFHDITLPTRAQSPHLSSKIKRCKDLYKLIRANPDIAKFVRDVTYTDSDVLTAISAGERHRLQHLDDTAHLVDPTLHLVLNRLVNLKSLSLNNFDLCKVSAKFATALLKRPVTLLSLDTIYIHHLKNLLILIRSSPELRSLYLRNITLVKHEWERANKPYETDFFTPDHDQLVPLQNPHSPAEVEIVTFNLCRASDFLCMKALRSPESPISLGKIEIFQVISVPGFENLGTANDSFLEISAWLLRLQPLLPKCLLPCLIPRDDENKPNTKGPTFPIKHVKSLQVFFNFNTTKDLTTSLEWWSHNFKAACGEDCLIQEIVLKFVVTDRRWDLSKIEFTAENWAYLDGLLSFQLPGIVDINHYFPLLRKVFVEICPLERTTSEAFCTRMKDVFPKLHGSIIRTVS